MVWYIADLQLIPHTDQIGTELFTTVFVACVKGRALDKNRLFEIFGIHWDRKKEPFLTISFLTYEREVQGSCGSPLAWHDGLLRHSN